MKRIPSSDTSGVSALGSISRNTIQLVFSPRRRAASTKSMTLMSMATARAKRYTRVESKIPITKMSTGTVEGNTDSTTRAKISVGIAMSTSTARDSAMSTQPPATEATKPATEPSVKDKIVASPAMTRVVCVPWIRRDMRSRPKLSVPNQCLADMGIHTSPTMAALSNGAIQWAKAATKVNAAHSSRPSCADSGALRTRFKNFIWDGASAGLPRCRRCPRLCLSRCRCWQKPFRMPALPARPAWPHDPPCTGPFRDIRK